MSESCDYQLWKAALLVKPTRTILYDIALSLGASSVIIEIAEANLCRHYIDTLTVEEFHRFVYSIFLCNYGIRKVKHFISN